VIVRALRAALLASAALLAFQAPAYASIGEDSLDAAWGDVEVLDDAEMADMRGGFSFGGVDFGFGAVITTYADGVRAMQTNLTWTDSGVAVSQMLGSLGQELSSMSAEQRAALGLEGMTDANGVVIVDGDGVTALVHNITDGALQNIIINNADGRDLRQEVDVTLTLPGFEAVQAGMLLDKVGIQLSGDLAHILAGGQ
jgi:hypothetical protein